MNAAITAITGNTTAPVGEIVYWTMSAAPMAHVEALLALVAAANPLFATLTRPNTMGHRESVAHALTAIRGEGEAVGAAKGSNLPTLITRTVPDSTTRTGARVEVVFRVEDAGKGQPPVIVWEDGEADPDREAAFLAAYHAARDTVGAAQWGSWLVAQAEGAHAVRLRDNGGVYYLPPHARTNWRTIAEIAKTFGKVYSIPAMAGDDCAAAVIDALAADAAAAIAAIEGDGTYEGMSAKMIEARIEKLDALAAKIGKYASAFGPAVDTIRATVSEAREKAENATMVLDFVNA